jgi:hypothetical protein
MRSDASVRPHRCRIPWKFTQNGISVSSENRLGQPQQLCAQAAILWPILAFSNEVSRQIPIKGEEFSGITSRAPAVIHPRRKLRDQLANDSPLIASNGRYPS